VLWLFLTTPQCHWRIMPASRGTAIWRHVGARRKKHCPLSSIMCTSQSRTLSFLSSFSGIWHCRLSYVALSQCSTNTRRERGGGAAHLRLVLGTDRAKNTLSVPKTSCDSNSTPGCFLPRDTRYTWICAAIATAQHTTHNIPTPTAPLRHCACLI
jgi:hypothetical protein